MTPIIFELMFILYIYKDVVFKMNSGIKENFMLEWKEMKEENVQQNEVAAEQKERIAQQNEIIAHPNRHRKSTLNMNNYTHTPNGH